MSSSLKEYPCDFYLAGGHSVGRASLSVYLSFFGAGVSMGEFWKGARERRKTHSTDFLEKYRRKGKKTGMTVDCLMWDYPGEKVLGWKAPVIWLVRDPVLLFTSFINAYLSGRIIEAFYGKVTLKPLFSLGDLCQLALNHPAEFYQHYKILRSIPNPAAVEVVDTEDTLPDRVEESLLRLLKFLKLDASALPDHREKIKISYGSLRNRVRTLPSMSLYAPDGRSLPVYPVRREMLPNTDFWHVADYRILTSMEHGDGVFDIIHFTDEAKPEEYMTAANLERLADYLERGLKLADFIEKYCRARLFSPEAVAETIKRDGRLSQKFIYLWENDWLKVDDYSPGHTRRWEYARLIAT